MANNLMRFDPFTDIARFDPLRNIDEFFSDFPLMMPTTRRLFGAAPRIWLDVTEDDQNYLVRADLPGVNKDDIKVAIDGNQVSISAEIKAEQETSGAGMLCRERQYGQMYRSLVLPQEVDDTNAQAKYENGVLQLTLPKKTGTSRRQLTIQ